MNSPTMQDLGDPKSFIKKAFSRYVPPVSPFDPEAPWAHVYQDASSHASMWIQGELTIKR